MSSPTHTLTRCFEVGEDMMYDHVVKNARENDALSVNEPEDSESSSHAPQQV